MQYTFLSLFLKLKTLFSSQCGVNSGLHIIIFDEIDAICKSRGSVVCIVIDF